MYILLLCLLKGSPEIEYEAGESQRLSLRFSQSQAEGTSQYTYGTATEGKVESDCKQSPS